MRIHLPIAGVLLLLITLLPLANHAQPGSHTSGVAMAQEQEPFFVGWQCDARKVILSGTGMATEDQSLLQAQLPLTNGNFYTSDLDPDVTRPDEQVWDQWDTSLPPARWTLAQLLGGIAGADAQTPASTTFTLNGTTNNGILVEEVDENSAIPVSPNQGLGYAFESFFGPHGAVTLDGTVASAPGNSPDIAQGLVAYTAVETDGTNYAGVGNTEMKYTWGGTGPNNGTFPNNQLAPRDPVSHILKLPAALPPNVSLDVFVVISELDKFQANGAEDDRSLKVTVNTYTGIQDDVTGLTPVRSVTTLVDKHPDLPPDRPDQSQVTATIDEPNPGNGLGIISFQLEEMANGSANGIQTIEIILSSPNEHVTLINPVTGQPFGLDQFSPNLPLVDENGDYILNQFGDVIKSGDSGFLTSTMVQFACPEDEPDPSQVTIEKVWQDGQGEPLETLPDGLQNFEIVAESSEADETPFDSITCSYDNSINLTCVETGTSTPRQGNILNVPAGGFYVVSESGLPPGASNVSGLGFFEVPTGTNITHTVTNEFIPPFEVVVLEKVWLDTQENETDPPVEGNGSIPGFSINAESDLGSATCTYQSGSLDCVYTNEVDVSGGLAVPENGTYSVDESGIPEGWQLVSGVGQNLQVGQSCVFNNDLEACVHTVTNQEIQTRPNPDIVVIEKDWEDFEGNPTTPPFDGSGSIDGFSITASSDLGSATCTYEDSSLTCVYTNDDPTITDGLAVPPGGTYSVDESGLPDGWEAREGVGSTLQIGQSCTFNNDEVCVHTVTNQEAEPKAITLLQFQAIEDTNGVVVSWTTGLERNTRGFYLLRSTDDDLANATQVTGSLIPATGSANGGNSYTWTDTTAESGVGYSYWLVEEELDGSRTEYGPVTVGSIGGPNADNLIFLPMVSR